MTLIIHINNVAPDELKGPILGVRHVQTILIFLLLVVTVSMRANLSLAIVAMTTSNTSINPDIPTYFWDNTGILLSSYYWVYPIPQFFIGHYAHIYGFKWFVIASILLMSLFTALTPLFAELLGSNGVIICRVIIGLSSGIIIPLKHTALGKWIPEGERSWSAAIVYAGFQLGKIVASSVTGYLSATSAGWPASFYVFGALGVLWCIIFVIFGFSSPASHPRISEKERKYIEISLGQHKHDETIRTPWKSIFISLPFWAIIFGSIGESWGGTTLSTQIPTYLSKVAKMDITSNGIFSSAPPAACVILSLIFGPLSDYLIAKKYCSRVFIRKFFQSVACFIPAVVLIWMTYMDGQMLIAIMFTIAEGVSAGFIVGHLTSCVDISPRFVGILFGIANGIGQVISIVSPIFVQYVVANETDKTQWRAVFITSTVVYVLSALFFIIFGSATRQPWDSGESKRTEKSTAESKHY